jgi:hypothetical protein
MKRMPVYYVVWLVGSLLLSFDMQEVIHLPFLLAVLRAAFVTVLLDCVLVAFLHWRKDKRMCYLPPWLYYVVSIGIGLGIGAVFLFMHWNTVWTIPVIVGVLFGLDRLLRYLHRRQGYLVIAVTITTRCVEDQDGVPAREQVDYPEE